MLGAEVYPVAGMISNIISFVDELQDVLLRFTLVHTQLSHSTTLKTTIIVCSFSFLILKLGKDSHRSHFRYFNFRRSRSSCSTTEKRGLDKSGRLLESLERYSFVK